LKSVGLFNVDVLELFLGLAALIGVIGSALAAFMGVVFLPIS